MFKNLKKNEKGFTLVELVVVIAILAILAVLLVPQIMGNVSKAKASKEVANARTIASQITVHNAVEKVNNGTNTIPATLPSSGTVTFATGTVVGTFGKAPDTDYAIISVDSDGNAKVTLGTKAIAEGITE